MTLRDLIRSVRPGPRRIRAPAPPANEPRPKSAATTGMSPAIARPSAPAAAPYPPQIVPTAIPVTPAAAAQAAALEALVPRLVTPRCTLRAPRLADFDALHAITSADTDGFLGGPFAPSDTWSDLCGMTATWLLRGHGLWTVEHDGATAGFVLIGTEPGDAEHELGWLFLDAYRGRGLATEAASAARDHAWTALALPSLVSYVATHNSRSERLAARLGAVPDGTAYEGRVRVWRHPRPAAP